MHDTVRKFIKHVRKETSSRYGRKSFFRFKKVLEIGSFCVNGSPRDYFWWCNYVGVDIVKGKGVDYIGKITDTDFGSREWDVVVSTEVMEHCKEWQDTLTMMYDLLKCGGLMIITCAAPDREIHGVSNATPEDSPATNDYYRNISMEDFRRVLPKELFSYYQLQYARGQNDLQFYGIKK